MPVIPFGPFTPDLPALGNPGVVTARNVFPSATGYVPVSRWQESTNALDARPRGAIRAKDFGGTAHSYAGDATKLYLLSGSMWTDASRGGGYMTGDGERWELVKWGDKILAANFSDDPQQIIMGGANFSDLTSDFRARHLAVVRNFVVAANTFDAADGVVSDRIRWSAFNDETNWTPDPATLADFTDLLTGGAIQRVTGGEFGVIFQESSIRRMAFVGSPTVFQIDEVLPGIGLLAPGAAVRMGRTVFFLSQRGFIALTDGTQPAPIGANRVDNFVIKDIDTDHLDRVSSAHDPVSGRVFWAYPGSGNTSGRPNKMVIYDINVDRWSTIDMEAELLWLGGGVAINLDTDDLANMPADAILDDVDISFDSPRYKGSGQNVQAFDQTFRTGAFDDDDRMDAEIQTGEREINDARHTRLNAFRPVGDAVGVSARIGTRNLLTDEVSWSPVLNLRNGRFTRRANARYHTFRFLYSGDWTYATGLQIGRGEAVPGERRS